jgi:hypothetical protein
MYTKCGVVRGGAAISFVVALAGCASTQLNYNTLELASTVGDIQTKQVLFNLSLLLDNPGAIPTHVDISSGTATTTSSVSPTFGMPMNSAVSVVDTVAKVASAAPSTTSTSQITSSLASNTATVQLQDQWVQNWAYDPVVAGDELRRLRSLYKYALGLIDDQRLIDEYPLLTKQLTINYAPGSSMGSIHNDPLYCPNIGLLTNGSTEDIARSSQSGALTAAECNTVQINVQIPDEHFMREPSCIICLGRHEIYTRRSRPRINQRLRQLHGGWLLTEADDIPQEAKYLGIYAHHSLYVRRLDLEKLSEFTLFILTATAQSATVAASSTQGGAGGAKSKANAPAVVSGPAILLPSR